jgi:hypothetical protein
LTRRRDRLAARTSWVGDYSGMPRSGLLVIGCVVAALLFAGCAGRPSSPTTLSGAACLARLDRQAVAYWRSAAAEAADPRCQVDTPVRVSRIAAALNQPATMSCALASRLDEFDREVVQPAALAAFGQAVSRIDHLGSYSCRAPNTSLRGRLSQHSLGLAIDIAGFRLADGTVVSVEHDWSAPGPNQVFLHQIARQACGYFSVVLSPDSNTDHYNHFHFDIGPDRLCSVL